MREDSQKFDEEPAVPPAKGSKVPFLEQLFLGMLLGFSIWQEDIERYAIYFTLLTETDGVVNCANLLSTFSTFFLVSTSIWCVSSPLTGWAVDYFKPSNLTIIFASSSFLQTFCFMAMYLRPWTWFGWVPPENFSWWYLLILFSVRQLAMNQSMTLNWKVIKLRVMSILHKGGSYSLEEEAAVMNSVANFGDLISDATELTVLGLFYLFFYYGKRIGIVAWPFQYGRMLIVGGAILGNLLTMAWTFRFLGTSLEVPNRLEQIKKSLKDPKDDISIVNERGEVVAAKAVDNAEDPLLHAQELDSPASSAAASKPGRGWFLDMFDWLSLRTKWFWYSRVAFAAVMMSILMDFDYVMAEYPLSMVESSDMETIPEKYQNPENYCGGLVANLMNQGAVVNLFFLCASIMYRIFLVKLAPKSFYRFVFPAAAVILLALTALLLTFKLPSLAVFTLVSLIQIIPYYIETYNEAVWAAAAEPELFGFLYSGFFMATYVLDLAIGVIMLAAIPNWLTMGVFVLALIGCVIYSIYVSFKYEHDFPAELEG